MPSLRIAQESNSQFSPSYTPVAVFVGGTSGIGQGMARALARATKGNVSIVIVGRNRQAAAETIASFPSSSKAQHAFIECNVLSMKNIETAISQILSSYPKINLLVASTAHFKNLVREETIDGLERNLALCYYARWKFIVGLLPALKRAKEEGEDAKVSTVLAPGQGEPFDFEDIAFTKNWSFPAGQARAAAYNELMIEELSAKNPELTFVHQWPGLVRSGLFSSGESILFKILNWVVPIFLRFLTNSSEDSGEYMLYGLLNSKNGAFHTKENGDDMGDWKRATPEERRKLWDWTVQATSVKL